MDTKGLDLSESCEGAVILPDGVLCLKYTKKKLLFEKQGTTPIVSPSKDNYTKPPQSEELDFNDFGTSLGNTKISGSLDSSNKQYSFSYSDSSDYGLNKERKNESENNYKVFISYSHRDNVPINPREENSWVDTWVNACVTALRRKSGGFRDYSLHKDIWYDKTDLNDAQHVTNEIRRVIKTIPVFMALLSESYLESPHCMDELRTFVNHNVLPNSAVILVEVTAIDDCVIPKLISSIQRKHLFWYQDGFDKHPYLPYDAPEYERSINKLVNSLAEKLKKFNEKTYEMLPSEKG